MLLPLTVYGDIVLGHLKMSYSLCVSHFLLVRLLHIIYMEYLGVILHFVYLENCLYFRCGFKY